MKENNCLWTCNLIILCKLFFPLPSPAHKCSSASASALGHFPGHKAILKVQLQVLWFSCFTCYFDHDDINVSSFPKKCAGNTLLPHRWSGELYRVMAVWLQAGGSCKPFTGGLGVRDREQLVLLRVGHVQCVWFMCSWDAVPGMTRESSW